MDAIVLQIDEATPSLNRMLGQHWSKKHRLNGKWRWLLKQATLAAKIYDRPRFERARVTIERTGGKVLDFDNLAGSTKGLVDLLVSEGFIAGDSPEHIGQPVLVQRVHPRLRQTVVRIEKLEEGSTNARG